MRTVDALEPQKQAAQGMQGDALRARMRALSATGELATASSNWKLSTG